MNHKISGKSKILLLIIFICTSLSADTFNNNYTENVISANRNAHLGTNINSSDDGTKKYVFRSTYKGDRIRWKVYIEDDKIVKLIKDGERVPDGEIADYHDYIMNEIKDYEDNPDDIDFNVDIDFDAEAFAESMDVLGEALSNIDVKINLDEDCDFKWNFDNDDWDWVEVNDSDENSFHINWDSEKFRRSMEQLEHKLKKLDNLDIQINMDMDEFAHGMEKFGESMSAMKIDFSGLEEDMEELKVKLKILGEFIEDVNEELVKDGYIDDDEENYDLELNKNEMYVNDQKLPDELHKKYIDIYKKHYGHEPQRTIRFRK